MSNHRNNTYYTPSVIPWDTRGEYYDEVEFKSMVDALC